VVSKITKKKRQQRPAAPFITSTLQQEAYRKLGFTPKRTMRLAQTLYEGKETEEGQMGLITYMRTDSHRLAKEAIDEVRGLIMKQFGKDYLPAKPIPLQSAGPRPRRPTRPSGPPAPCAPPRAWANIWPRTSWPSTA
jgi:DNA topoisomerase IA